MNALKKNNCVRNQNQKTNDVKVKVHPRVGRPSNNNVIKFSQEPKSIISQLLMEERQKSLQKDIPLKFTTNVKSKVRCTSNRQSLDKTSNDSQSPTSIISQFLKEDGYKNIDFNECIVREIYENPIPIVFPNVLPNNKVNLNLSQLLKSQEKPPEKSIRSDQHNNQDLVGAVSIPIKVQDTKKKDDDGLKVYVCPYPQCTYFSKISSNVSKHKRTHSHNKLYFCDQCPFSTKFSNSLNVHKRLHTNEKPFICQYCDYRCNSSSNLKTHVRHRHRSLIPTAIMSPNITMEVENSN